MPSDVLEAAFKKKSSPIPPRGLIYTGSGNFEQEGRKYLKYFKTLGSLKSHENVLDIGSGIGRMALPLTEYLDKTARYEGFDVVKKGVDWCNKHIAGKYRNFNFEYIPLKNDLYTETGLDASAFRFPYDNDTFHFAISTSVFTHMLPEQVGNYLNETSRVLRPGGRLFATFFIKNSTFSNSRFNFPYDYGHYSIMDQKVPSANVAYDMSYLEETINKAGLKIHKKLSGKWSGDPGGFEFQDVLILSR